MMTLAMDPLVATQDVGAADIMILMEPCDPRDLSVMRCVQPTVTTGAGTTWLTQVRDVMQQRIYLDDAPPARDGPRLSFFERAMQRHEDALRRDREESLRRARRQVTAIRPSELNATPEARERQRQAQIQSTADWARARFNTTPGWTTEWTAS